MQLINTRNQSKCSWDARQHQFNFIRRSRWSISSNFSENSVFKCPSQPEIAQKFTEKQLFFDFKVIQGHRCWYPRQRSSAVLVMISSKSVSLSATVLMLDKSTVAEIACFEGGTHTWYRSMEDSFNLGGRNLHC